MNCILCQSANTRLLRSISAAEHIANFRATLGIDISSELDCDRIDLYQCRACYLQFFPSVHAGSEWLYEQLRQIDGYYEPYKWEFATALRDIRKGDRVLEVGCGVGHFLERLSAEKRVDYLGIDLSTAAASTAQELGRTVQVKRVEDLAREQNRAFDVVCAFQVLEHASDPGAFLNACVDLLASGGRLLLAVPDNDGYIGAEYNHLLNLPPHHITRWTRRAFERLPAYFPLRLKKLSYEPLALRNLDRSIKFHSERVRRMGVPSPSSRWLMYKIVAPTARRTGWYSRWHGHSIYAQFETR